MFSSTWLHSAVYCLISFGLWGFFSRLALNYITPKQAMIFQSIGIILVTLFLLKEIPNKSEFNWVGSFYAILTGIAFTVGSILFLMASSQNNNISIVITLTGLYPLITIVLAYLFLKESINFQQFLGMLLAMVAMGLLAKG